MIRSVSIVSGNPKNIPPNFSSMLSFLRKLFDTFDLNFTLSAADDAFRLAHQPAYSKLRSTSVDDAIRDMVRIGKNSPSWPFDLKLLQKPSTVLATAASIDAFALSILPMYRAVPWTEFLRVAFAEVLLSWSANPKRSRALMFLFFEAIALHIHEDVFSRLPRTTRTSAADHVDVRVTFWAAAFLNSLLCPGFEGKKDNNNKWHTIAVVRHASDQELNAERQALITKTLSAITRCSAVLPRYEATVLELRELISKIHHPIEADIAGDVLHSLESPDDIEQEHNDKHASALEYTRGFIDLVEGTLPYQYYNVHQVRADAPEEVIVPSGDGARVVDDVMNRLDAEGVAFDRDDEVDFIHDFIHDNEAERKELQEKRRREEIEIQAKRRREETEKELLHTQQVSQVLDSLCQTVAREAAVGSIKTAQAIERVVSEAKGDDSMAASIVTAILSQMSAPRAAALVKEALFDNNEARVIAALVPSLEFIASPPSNECMFCMEPLDFTNAGTVYVTCCDGNMFSCHECTPTHVASHPQHKFTFERSIVSVMGKFQGRNGGV